MIRTPLKINFPPPGWGTPARMQAVERRRMPKPRARVGVKSLIREINFSSNEPLPPPPHPLPPREGEVVVEGRGPGKNLLLVLLLFTFINISYANPPKGPNLGQPTTPEEIAHWDIGVMPDGEGLPEGKGTALAGKPIYEKHCVACHGPEGVGGSADALAGAKMALNSDYPEQTIGSYWPYATTIFDMTRRSMPIIAPGTLTNDEVYAITAYLLYLNNIIGEDDEMNAETLPQVQMPNRDRFINAYELEKTR